MDSLFAPWTILKIARFPSFIHSLSSAQTRQGNPDIHVPCRLWEVSGHSQVRRDILKISPVTFGSASESPSECDIPSKTDLQEGSKPPLPPLHHSLWRSSDSIPSFLWMTEICALSLSLSLATLRRKLIWAAEKICFQIVLGQILTVCVLCVLWWLGFSIPFLGHVFEH